MTILFLSGSARGVNAVRRRRLVYGTYWRCGCLRECHNITTEPISKDSTSMTHKSKEPRPAPKPDGKTALERMADLTRRIVAVPKSEMKRKDRKRTKAKN